MRLTPIRGEEPFDGQLGAAAASAYVKVAIALDCFAVQAPVDPGQLSDAHAALRRSAGQDQAVPGVQQAGNTEVRWACQRQHRRSEPSCLHSHQYHMSTSTI